MGNISTNHDEVVIELTRKLNDTSRKIEQMIDNFIEKVEQGKVPSAGQIYLTNIRNLRINALMQYQSIKTEIYRIVSGSMTQETKMDKLDELEKLIENRNVFDTKKEKAKQDMKSLKKDMALPEYKKFQLYGEKYRKNKHKGKINDNEDTQNGCSKDTGRAHKDYIFERNRNLAIGVIATILCMVFDFSIIYAVFLESNMGEVLSLSISIISVGVLDAPPYILGTLWTKKGDKKRHWELWRDKNDPGLDIELKLYNITIGTLLIAIVIIFGAYLSLRVFLFLGGGDFNLALHSLLNKNFTFESIAFNSSDLLSTVVPLGTSTVAFAIGVLCSSSYTDYVQRTIVIINKNLELQIMECEKVIVDSEEKRKNISNEIISLKRRIWSFYIGNTSLPKDEGDFCKKVFIAFQKLNLQSYRQTYEECCILLRNRAIEMIQHINEVMVIYTTDQTEITSMKNSVEENALLDDIWVISDKNTQHELTLEHTSAIEKYIKQLEQRLIKSNVS